MRWATTFAACLSVLTASGVQAQELAYSEVERGRYLTKAANCMGCHTDLENDGIPFSGGRGLETPFGLIYSQNLTPDDETGLGRWTRDDFYRAMTEGTGRDGEQLYPAFPYPYFTIMPRQDVDAIYAYLRTLEPVHVEIPDHELPFPFNVREAVIGWKLLNFDEGELAPDPAQSEQWNRGRYLVDGPAHCGACHTGKNLMGGDEDHQYMRGGVLENWFAPNIRGGENGGISHWDVDDIVAFLKDGRSHHTAPMQRMGEVVELSTQYLEPADLEAIGIYLKSLDDEPRQEPQPASEARLTAGRAIYFDNCAACHGAEGDGLPYLFAPLAGSNKVTAEDPSSIIRIILSGAQAVPTEAAPGPLAMPAFDWKLDDEEVADLVTYLRQAWSNRASEVSPSSVADMRSYLEDH